MPEVYAARAVVYYNLKDYDRAWNDVRKAQKLGDKMDEGFLKQLREAWGKEN